MILLTLVRAFGQGLPTPDLASPAPPSPVPVEIELSWIGLGNVFAGVGYNDNVLLSHADEDRSGFVRGGLEATSWNALSERLELLTGLRAFGTRYFSSKEINHTEQAYLLLELNYRIHDGFKFSLDGSASYSHLIYDVSETDLEQVVSEVKRSAVGLAPTLRWTPHRWFWIEAQAAARRETYPDGFYNRTVHEDSLRFAWTPGKRFEASVAGSESRRHYDVRTQYSVSGRPLDGTELKILERDGELRLKATLDAAGNWKSVTKLNVTRFTDNGSGYLNYHERKVSQDIDWSSGDWTVEFESAARRLEYTLQTVGLGVNPPPRVRDGYYLRLRIERALTPRWAVFTEYTWDRNRFNDPIASYSMNEGLLGLRWNWEK